MSGIEEDYKQVKKELRKQKIISVWSKTRHMLNIMPTLQKQEVVIPEGPDVSTITEHIAFIIDDEVVEIMHCQPKLAAILLSEPQIIKINDGEYPKPGWKYKDGIFKEPMPEREITTARDEEAIEHGIPTFKEFQENMKQASALTFKEFIEKLRKK